MDLQLRYQVADVSYAQILHCPYEHAQEEHSQRSHALGTKILPKKLWESNMSVEEILAEDLKNAEEKQVAKTADVTSRLIGLGKKNKTGVIRSNLLGPILRKRFMGDRTIHVG